MQRTHFETWVSTSSRSVGPWADGAGKARQTGAGLPAGRWDWSATAMGSLFCVLRWRVAGGRRLWLAFGCVQVNFH